MIEVDRRGKKERKEKIRRNNDFLRAELLYIAHELSKKANEEREGKKIHE